ncbi:MAG: SPOR domain-containing protein [Acidiferrobacterales bacterium]|nr:SPOR domain-containing protein [Acidiferrobacterales bacterium]
MTRNNEVSTENEADFVLKHRIAGAAFLIFFGVLILPWLLSAPSQSVQANAEALNQEVSEMSQDDIEQELLAAIENEKIVEQDLEIYVSRITPLDAQAEEPRVASPSEAAQESSEASVEEEGATTEPAEEVEPEIVETAIVEPKVEEPKEQTPEPKQETVATQPANSVEVGWVVQVGVFTDSKGAAKVVADLKSKGFAPSTTIVDTNLGKATGTRVWLGPYAQRVEAAKSKTTLKDKTGGDGFIRAYP